MIIIATIKLGIDTYINDEMPQWNLIDFNNYFAKSMANLFSMVLC